MGRSNRKLAALGVVLALAIAACGNDGGTATTGDSTTAAPDEQLQLGYSAPFLFNEYSVILQDSITAAAEAAGFEMLPPTNADSDSAQQNTDMRNLISAGADGLIVFANDSAAIVPALD